MSTEAPGAPLLELSGFGVRFAGPAGEVQAAADVNLAVRAGECLAVVGASGAGKSQLFLGALGLLGAQARLSGSARLGGRELAGLAPAALDALRGRRVGLVFQDPMTSLTPHLRIGTQIAEVRRRHLGESRAVAAAAALRLLQRVQVSDAAQRLRQFPHELSGGMRQRVIIAIALAGEPQLLIADEPTTALDVTVQAQILGLLGQLKRDSGLALVLISHDLGAVAGIADEVAVMRAGRVIECAPVRQLFAAPREAYTQDLLRTARAAPPIAPAHAPGEVALQVQGLSVRYPGARGARAPLAALTAAEFSVAAGESLAVVGESGSGKSTLARALLKLIPHAAGRIVWMGEDLDALSRERLRAQRRDLQIIFQDPLGSLDPRMRVAEIVAEGLRVHEPALAAPQRAAAVRTALARVGLGEELLGRFPHQLSGGQGQRVGIARAMALAPRLLVCDEPVSSLDAHSQAQVVELLASLKGQGQLSLVFVSHNLEVVRRLCERTLVLYLGRMMELAPTAALFRQPHHPYTRELLEAIPVPDPQVEPGRLGRVRPGEAPSPQDPPSGCVYRTRCPAALPACAARVPEWERHGDFQVACLRWREL